MYDSKFMFILCPPFLSLAVLFGLLLYLTSAKGCPNAAVLVHGVVETRWQGIWSRSAQ